MVGNKANSPVHLRRPSAAEHPDQTRPRRRGGREGFNGLENRPAVIDRIPRRRLFEHCRIAG